MEKSFAPDDKESRVNIQFARARNELGFPSAKRTQRIIRGAVKSQPIYTRRVAVGTKTWLKNINARELAAAALPSQQHSCLLVFAAERQLY